MGRLRTKTRQGGFCQAKARDLAFWLAGQVDLVRAGQPHASREEVQQRFFECHGKPLLFDDGRTNQQT